jgi:hypothetical protein
MMVGRRSFARRPTPATTYARRPEKRVMGRLRTTAAASLIFLAALPLSAAHDDFYLNLLHRGMAHVDAGQYDTAIRELHIAAFGLVDSIPQFEIAHIYITLAADHLKNEADARRSAQRVIAAERIERRYGALSIPDSARHRFDDIASRLLTNDQYAFLRSSPVNTVASSAPPPAPPVVSPPVVTQPPAPAPRETTIVVPMPQPQPEPRVRVQPLPPTPVPAPRSVPPAPQPQPTRAAPQPTVSASQPPARPHVNADAQLTLADAAIDRDDIRDAARIYKAVLEDPNLTHAQLLRVGKGAYRARDFVDSARAFEHSGFRSGEEPYRYYYAVALYEHRDYAAAKRELAAALPYVELTREVARYRTKIESAVP